MSLTIMGVLHADKEISRSPDRVLEHLPILEIWICYSEIFQQIPYSLNAFEHISAEFHRSLRKLCKEKI